jgi:two-component system KDP operon response regulator KdpE
MNLGGDKASAPRVLVVEDELAVLKVLATSLRANGYDPVVAATGRAALDQAESHPPAAVLLDLGLPDMDGEDVITELRSWCSAPIIVLSARRNNADKVSALDIGADDYVTKPFSIEELLARLRAAIRRGGPDAADSPRVVTSSGFVVDLARSQVLDSGEAPIRLTPTEWHVLEVLVRRDGQLVNHSDLLTEVWGPGYEAETNYLRIYIAQLRAKLESDAADPRHILTEVGRGYRFVASP